jgi:hypothetical protein
MMRLLKTASWLLLVSGSAVAADLEQWKGIAGISGTDRISVIHITNLLLSHGIKSAIEGSVIYGVSVPPAQAELASQLLRTNAAKLGYYIWFGSNDVVRAAGGKQLISRSAVSSALKKPALASGTALGEFLRSKDISQLTAKYPYVVALSAHERQYLPTPKTYATGYDVQIELQKSLRDDADGYRGRYQVYDGGRRVEFLGSNEWRAGSK